MTTIEATLVESKLESKDKTQRLFKISRPLTWETWDDEDTTNTTDFVLVSRIIATDHGGWETMIFPANAQGEVIHWGELWCVREWEHMGTTINNFVESLNKETEDADRLQAGSSFLD